MGKITALMLVFVLSLSPVMAEVASAALAPQRVPRDAEGWEPWATTGRCPVAANVDTPQKLFNVTRDMKSLMAKLGERFTPAQADEIKDAMVEDRMEERVMPAGTLLAFMLSGCAPIDKVRVVTNMPSWYIRLSDGTEVYAPKDCLNFSAVAPSAQERPRITSVIQPESQRYEQTVRPPIRLPAVTPPREIRTEIPQITNTNVNTFPVYTPNKGSGNGKWWAVGLAAIGAAALCAWKCRGGNGGGVVVNNTNINSNPAAFVPVVSTLVPPVVTTLPPTGGSSLPICTNPTQTGCVR